MNLFDAEHYLRANADVRESDIHPLQHYLEYGWREGRNPHPLFDTAYYVSQVPELSGTDGDPLSHFSAGGWREGYNPHPLFDTAYYVSQVPELSGTDGDPLSHFIAGGWREGYNPHPLFHTKYYLETYPDVAQCGVNPLGHFCTKGFREDRNPHPLFATRYYLDSNPDLRHAGSNPLVHYCKHGWQEGRSPHPLFSVPYYQQTYPEITQCHVEPLRHYYLYGWKEDRDPHLFFSSSYYLECNPYLTELGLNPLEHFCRWGWREAKQPHPLFDTAYYRGQLGWKPKEEYNPLEHFLFFGMGQGLSPHPLFDEAFYRSQFPDNAFDQLAPYAHYLTFGATNRLSPHPLFDAEAYLKATPDCQARNMSAGIHYARFTCAMPQELLLRCNAAMRANPELYGKTAPETANEKSLQKLVDFLHPGAKQRPCHKAPAGVALPLISIVMPTYNTPVETLRKTIESIKAQSYTNWELCIEDDGSTDPDVKEVLQDYAALDDRITVAFSPANRGISLATNAAMARASGQYVTFVDHDDLLEPFALQVVVEELLDHPGVQALYSDQDVIEPDGTLAWILRKPDWDPELFCGVMYVGHLLVVERELALRIGGFDRNFDRVQDFEFMLRVGEHADRIRHIPKILYHWVKLPGSVASGANAKGRLEDVQCAAVNASLRRRGVPLAAVPHPVHAHRAQLCPASDASPRLAVTLVFGAACGQDHLHASLEALFADSNRKLDALVFPSQPLHLSGAFQRRCMVVPGRAGLSEREQLELALNMAEGELILYMRQPLLPASKQFLDHLEAFCRRDPFAFAAPVLLGPDGRVDHSGLVLDRRHGLVRAMAGQSPEAEGFAGSLCCTRRVSAASAACVMFRKERIADLGPFQPALRSSRYLFPDLCLRAAEAGLRTMVVATASARQLACDQPDDTDLVDREFFMELWRDRIESPDPYCNYQHLNAYDAPY